MAPFGPHEAPPLLMNTMAVQQVACYLLCIVLTLLLPPLLLKLVKRGGNNSLNLPPGPWKLPVIGNLHQVARGGPLVHRTMAKLARRLDAPLMCLQLGELRVVVASSADAAREIMKTQDATFATRPWNATTRLLRADGEGLVFARYGALWRQLRKLCVAELLGWGEPRKGRSAAEGLGAAVASAGRPGTSGVGGGRAGTPRW